MCALGRDPKYVCWKSPGKGEGILASAAGGGPEAVRGGTGGGGEASSDEEEEEEDDGGGQREDNGKTTVGRVPSVIIPFWRIIRHLQ